MVHLPNRIEHDAHFLFIELVNDESRQFRVVCDTQEYADAVLTILEGLYPGAGARMEFEIRGIPPGTTA